MRYTAKYLNRTNGAEYWRTVFGGDLNEAIKIAERYVRRGYLLATLTAA